MTGYHTGHAQVRGNLRTGGSSLGLTNTGQHPLAKGTVTIGHLLQQRGYRTGDWKLVKNSPRRAGVTRRDRRTELFHLAADPGERHDLAAQMPDKVRELEAEMARQHRPSKNFPLVRKTNR